MFQHIKVEKDEFVGTITIDRQRLRNALNKATIDELQVAVGELEEDPKLRIIIITGAGEKAFVAGADIKELHERTMLEALVPGMQKVYREIEQSSKVTIAVINGHALGGGFELALACDLRVVANHAKMGLPELNLAIIPGAGGTQRLMRIVGKGRALEMILTGKIINGQEAERIGLVTQSVESNVLWNVTNQLVESILSKGPLALKLAKMVVNRGQDVDLDTALMLEKLAQTVLFASEEKHEGTQAFLEKRRPNYHEI
ncbi:MULTISPECIES: enoyl-CoA hydratase/isomerase family protein [Priestia]|uniref:enoyl-CoA hydratase/isomerase family protein n=1 Tax=Priestia TaxID=2800373 RepID=UPI0005ED2630|nr:MULTISPECIES: enoyl-CoA hydratase-related protein [Priestia]KJL06685.1 enoyl-CoA hydratase [Priestia aryabhattai B8W22]MBX4163434.1 enoyl-CoA hydratase/isomerase family protein [Priestia megaterium]MED3898255.1 enoyl-CoA hydratase-related protein [Priestia aryabhattai]